MSKKRFQPVDRSNEATLLLVQVSFRDGIVEKQAVEMEIRRYKELFIISVIKYYLVGGKELQLFLHVPNRICTAVEAEERNRQFDLFVESGFPSTAGLPAVPPQTLWRSHNLSPDKLSKVSDFMHLFSQAVCNRCRLLQGKKQGLKSGPYVASRYKLVGLNPAKIPESLIQPGLLEAVNDWFGIKPAPLRIKEKCYSSAYAIGDRRFVTTIGANEPFGFKASKSYRKITLFDLDLAWHYAKETKAELKQLVNDETGITWAEELIEDIHDFCSSSEFPKRGGPEVAFLSTLPFVLLLHIIDGTLRWRKLKRMKEDGTFDLLRTKAKMRARTMLGLD